MRNPFRGDRSGRRVRELGCRDGVSGVVVGPPFGVVVGVDEEAVIDPVELMAIRADDEILDDLALALTAAPVFGLGAGDASGSMSCLGSDPRYADDLRLLALLREWRHDVGDEPWPELVSVEQARTAVLAGDVQPVLAGPRGVARRRRPTPVAALAVASVVAALGMSGLAFAAGQARPGDALWGVSKMLDAKRATSLEAEGRVGVALASARRALAEGRAGDARAELAGAARELRRVGDSAIRQDLARTTENLTVTAQDTPDGRKVDTDEHGESTGPARDPDQAGGSTSSAATSGGQGDSGSDRDRRSRDRPPASSRGASSPAVSSPDSDARSRAAAPDSRGSSTGPRPTRPAPTTTRPAPTTTGPAPTTTRPAPTTLPAPTTTLPAPTTRTAPTTTRTAPDSGTPDRRPRQSPPHTATGPNGHAPSAHGR